MKAIRKKLRSRRGESLTEVLISVLIAALASTLLAGMVSASVRMIQSSSAALEYYYNIDNWKTHSGTITFTLEDESGVNSFSKISEEVTAKTIQFGNGDREIFFYQINKDGT